MFMIFTTISNNHSFIANSFVTHNCPAETPEGHACGIVKNMSFTCHISLPFQADIVEQLLYDLGVKLEINEYRVFLNGKIIGSVNTENTIVETLREYRRTGKINYDVSIVDSKKMKEIIINYRWWEML
jgi:DNA-directed RNA polymerase beta subunit